MSREAFITSVRPRGHRGGANRMDLGSPSAGTEPGPFPRGPVGLAGGAVAAVTLALLVVAVVLSPAAIRFVPR